MHRAALVASGLVVVAIAGCNERATDREKIGKPADTVASAKASASAVPIVVAVTAPRCENGWLNTPPVDATGDSGSNDGGDAEPGAEFGFGGLGLSGTGGGGTGEGIGLGTLGGGGIAKANRTALKGQTLDVDGLPREDVETIVCKAYGAFTRCFDEFATSANDLDGTVGLALSVDSEGHVAAKVVGGTLDDAKLATCLAEAAGKLTFTPAPAKAATATYAFSVHRPRKVKAIKMLEAGTTVTGRLPPEVIKRITRANFPRFRFCYEQELKKDPTLKGTVITKFVIDTTGAVEPPTAAGGTMGNATVQACVTKVFSTMAFPEPEGGKVMVTYPIDFKNED